MTASAEPAQSSPSSPLPPRHGLLYMVAMGAMTSGFTAVDFLTNNMIPVTLRHFTESKFLISIIIDLNRLFGFVVQPFVAWKSDSLVSRLGRRRPFLLVGIPATLIFVLLLGFFPVIFKAQVAEHAADVARYADQVAQRVPDPVPVATMALGILAVLFAVNVFLQAFLDVNWGVEALLYADTFPKSLLGRAYSVRQTLTQVATLALLLYSLPLAVKNEVYPYFGSAAVLALSFLIVLFVIREHPAHAAASAAAARGKYKVLSNLKLIITNPTYLKVALVSVLQLVIGAVFTLFLSLFAKETLQMNMKEFSHEVMVLGFVVGVATALIGGQFVDRLGAKYVAAMGFVLCMVSSAGIVWLVHDKSALKWANAIYLAGQALIGVAAFPLLFIHAPEAERGKVFGLIQFLRASSAFAVSPLVGYLADLYKSYRPGYVIAIVLSAIGLIAALSVPAKSTAT